MAPAPKTTEAPTLSTPDVSDLYMAIREDLRLVITPRYPIFGAGGRQVGQQPGEALQFREGVLRVPHKGKVPLEDGRQKDANEVREFLDEHTLVGDRYMGFWKVDAVAPPVSEQEQAALMDATMELNVDGLKAMLETEQSGWKREPLIRNLERAIAKIELALTPADEQPEK